MSLFFLLAGRIDRVGINGNVYESSKVDWLEYKHPNHGNLEVSKKEEM